MLRFALTLILLLGLEWPSKGALSPEEGAALSLRIHNDPRFPRIDVKVLTKEERDFLLIAERTNREQFGSSNDELLFRLGDGEMTKRFVRHWYEGDRTILEDFAESGRPELIPMIAPVLFRAEDFKIYGSDAMRLPQSFYTVTAIVNLLRSIPEFNYEVLRWAQSLDAETDQEAVELREILRDWWRANEQPFKEKNYRAVKPGRNLGKRGEVEKPLIEPPVPPSPGASSKGSLPAPPVLATSSASTPAQRATIWPWLVGAAAMLGIGAMAWRRWG